MKKFFKVLEIASAIGIAITMVVCALFVYTTLVSTTFAYAAYVLAFASMVAFLVAVFVNWLVL